MPAQQNPSPMVGHTRAHPRLKNVQPPGRRIGLDLGTLFISAGVSPARPVKLLLFFYGGDWIPELAAARQRNMAVIAIQAGAGSSSCAKLVADRRF